MPHYTIEAYKTPHDSACDVLWCVLDDGELVMEFATYEAAREYIENEESGQEWPEPREYAGEVAHRMSEAMKLKR